VGGVVRPELQHLQQPDQPAAVVVGVGGAQRGLDRALIHRALGLVLVHQLAQGRLATGHRGEHHLAHRLVWGRERGAGDGEQDVLLAGDPLERVDELLGDLAFSAGGDAVHCGD